MSEPPELTVVVMAWNEVASFNAICMELLAVLDGTKIEFELLVVDDGSIDGTERLADALAASNERVRVVHHESNVGLGAVYRTGFREAKGELITFFPADGQFPATIIEDFLPCMSEVELVLGYLPWRESSLISKALSAMERALYAILFGTLPRFQGILMFRRSLLARYELRSAGRGWAVLMEFIILCDRDGVRMRSVPTNMRPRTHGESKVNNWRTVWSNFQQMLALRTLLPRRIR